MVAPEATVAEDPPFRKSNRLRQPPPHLEEYEVTMATVLAADTPRTRVRPTRQPRTEKPRIQGLDTKLAGGDKVSHITCPQAVALERAVLTKVSTVTKVHSQ